MVDIKGLDKADVLAALYNASSPLGMGRLQFRDGDMTREQAQELLGGKDSGDYPGGDHNKDHYFDYLYGRVMKVNLKGDSFDEWGYDRDLGAGAAQRVIDRLRESLAVAKSA
jgi:hypothetical protein